MRSQMPKATRLWGIVTRNSVITHLNTIKSRILLVVFESESESALWKHCANSLF